MILGLDAALPLITDSNRLSWRDAHSVQTIQTNSGYYGDVGSIGHMDVCVNDGNIQPFCADSRSKTFADFPLRNLNDLKKNLFFFS